MTLSKKFYYKVLSDIKFFNKIAGLNREVSIMMLLNPRIFPVFLIRLAIYLQELNLTPIARFIQILLLFLFGLEFNLKIKIGYAFFIGHTVGVVLGASVIGSNCVVSGMCTMGSKEMDPLLNNSLRPKIGGNVIIGAGCRIIGGINVCANVKLGANTVVPFDIREPGTYVGVPAKKVQ
jgi:serine O-acetyltransferase